ncbi:helix-turn-helix domain-containing protein [Pseudobacteriovorax antillogorgiicola]|uniref:Transcriptional regulator, XRE family with cupin sensor n=1 Tax=Pseudobacteriovorax antillogorgiicola TaxID=1513793 RepID=A0A1Y6B6R0_9BACT|nr:XRE family transcriptional regulator [Pseudobacteriovorax antillogorgiicola]TCS58771.1 XRE family transcriptional regulator [Pseudobacteriovorax antillogorgiicola]SME94916.1 transcriptional regulator, XRE family with cupin sensor [Pseudobacteriovorax antillogorgiicola]
MEMTESYHLAKNIKYMRLQRKYSQEQLARRADIPRTTLSNLESGTGNPSLRTLVSLAKGLRVSVEELLSPPHREVELIKKQDLPLEERGKVCITKILPEVRSGFAIDRVKIEARGRMKGAPHKVGTKEYLCPLKGSVTLFLEGDAYIVKAGDLLIFPGDHHHSYQNSGDSVVEFISIVSLPH